MPFGKWQPSLRRSPGESHTAEQVTSPVGLSIVSNY